MFSKAFRLNPSGIALTSLRTGRFIDANDAFLRSTGYDRAEIIGRTAAEIRLIRRQEDRLAIMAALRDHDRIRRREFEFLTRDGDIRTGILSAEVIEIRGAACMLSHVADVTEARRLERTIMTIGDRERRKIGQDIHDDLCPHLIGIEGLVRVMKRRLEKGGSGEAAATEQIERFIREAIDKSRRLARGLCPVDLVDRGLEHSFAALARNTRLAFGIPCALSANGTIGISDHDTQTHLFRIVQEAVNNAARHSGAGQITVDVAADRLRTTVTVTDDGAGMPADADPGGMGLRIMRHRARMIGGILEIRPAAGGGTVVRIILRHPIEGGGRT
jgi:PAS domain S-box-containing protein